MKPLSRTDAVLNSCYNPKCCFSFTPTKRGQVCSGCHKAAFCNPVCQKIAWPQHRKECKERQLGIPQAMDTPFSVRRPDVAQDIEHYKEAIAPTLHVVARSALRIGRLDSIAEVSFLYLVIGYTERTKETQNTPGEDLFDLMIFKCFSDDFLDEHIGQIGVSSEEKKRECQEFSAGWPRPKTGLYMVFNFCIPNEPGERVITHSQYFPVSHYDGTFTPFRPRQLNPDPDALFKFFPKPPRRDSPKRAKHVNDLIRFDVAYSESIEYAKALQTNAPAGGWDRMYEVVGKMKRDLASGVEKEPLPYSEMVQKY